MALTGSGQLKFSEMRDEFGGSGQVKFSDLYRGGSLVRAKAANNTSTNLAASVPTSGEIQVADFYSAAKAFRKTYDSGATNQDASSVFGDDYGVDYPKEIVIDSGVELGATSTSQEALQIDSGLSGSLTVTNNGTLTGAGGAAGSAGGDALQVDVTCTVVNNGVIRSGGGGGGSGGNGGTGGTGGQGRTSSTGWGNTTAWQGGPGISAYRVQYQGDYGTYTYRWNSANLFTTYSHSATQTHGGYQYERGTNHYGDFSHPQVFTYYIRRSSQVTNYTYHNGGSGGSGGSGGGGGVGQGYNQSAGSGSSGSSGSGGSSGGSNAGNGGTGGTGGAGGAGGAYGASGSSGSSGNSGATGANGNYSNGSSGSGGSSGSSGASAGASVRGTSNITGGITGSGSLTGSTVS